MSVGTIFVEPKAVRVFAHLAAIKDAEARRLLRRAAATHGAYVSPNGDVLYKDKDAFARLWEEASRELREESRCAS